MSNAKKGITLAKLTPETETLVQAALSLAAVNRLSVSAIYDAADKVFETKHERETCASCLRREVTKLQNWYLLINQERDAAATTAKGSKEAKAATTAPAGTKGDGFVRPENAVEYTDVTDAAGEAFGTILFTPSEEDETKGQVTTDNGSYVKPGKYGAGDYQLNVSVGGKATVVNTLV